MSLSRQQSEVFRARIKSLESDNEAIKNSLRNMAQYIDSIREQTVLNTIFCEWFLNASSKEQQNELMEFAAKRGIIIKDSEAPDFVKPQDASKIIVPGR